MKIWTTLAGITLATVAPAVGATSFPASASADAGTYLLNVTVRPGYNFGGVEDALNYGYSICDRAAQGRSYPEIVGDLKADFATSDEFQASYLIAQAVNELCPQLIWQLRNSAAHYRPSAP